MDVDVDVDVHYDLIKVMWRTFESRLLSRLGRLTRAHTNQVILRTSCTEKTQKQKGKRQTDKKG